MAKLLHSTLFQSKGALMIKAKKNKALSLLLVAAMVITLLPMGALTAFAATASEITPTSASSSYTVVKGTSGAYVKDQAAQDITIYEADGGTAWPSQDTTVSVTLDDTTNVDFSEKPTVTVTAGSASVTSVSLVDSDTVTFKVSGASGTRDKVKISGIKYDVGPTSATTVDLTVTDPSGDSSQTVKNARVKDGVILSASAEDTTVSVGSNNQDISPLVIAESDAGVATENSKITVTLPEGFTFYAPPEATVTGLVLTSNYGAIDGRTVSWTVKTESSGSGGTISFTPYVNVASTAAADTNINATISVTGGTYAVAPSSVKVGKTDAGDLITAEAVSAPSVAKDVNQVAGDIKITESKKETIDSGSGDDTLTVEITSGNATFANTPKAQASGSGLTIENSDEEGVTTAVSGTPSGSSRVTWNIGDQSSADGASILINGISLNVTGDSGAIQVQVSGSAIDITKTITIANISSTSNVSVTASGTPAIKINTADQAAGDLVLTESKSEAINSSTNIYVRIFGVTTDKEVQYAKTPTVSVTSGNITLGTTSVSTDTSGVVLMTIPVTTKSSTKSVIKISDIKYDVNAKATEGAVQLLVSTGTSETGATRLASVTNANISKTGSTFSDVAAGHWAKTFIDYLATKGIIGGYTDGTFKPEGVISRAEFAKIAVIAGGYTLSTTSTTSSFSDVASSHWAIKYIETAKNQGIIGGYADGTFKPDAKITRAELAKIVVEAGKFTINNTGTAFPDVAADHWAYDYIMTAKNLSIIGGYPDGTFGPAKNATRAEASKMVYEWLN